MCVDCTFYYKCNVCNICTHCVGHGDIDSGLENN